MNNLKRILTKHKISGVTVAITMFVVVLLTFIMMLPIQGETKRLILAFLFIIGFIFIILACLYWVARLLTYIADSWDELMERWEDELNHNPKNKRK